ncbi:hypothetical protein ABFA07_006753 [Porites harrisoni]
MVYRGKTLFELKRNPDYLGVTRLTAFSYGHV